MHVLPFLEIERASAANPPGEDQVRKRRWSLAHKGEIVEISRKKLLFVHTSVPLYLFFYFRSSPARPSTLLFPFIRGRASPKLAAMNKQIENAPPSVENSARLKGVIKNYFFQRPDVFHLQSSRRKLKIAAGFKKWRLPRPEYIAKILNF
jgi:hypothetical protein